MRIDLITELVLKPGFDENWWGIDCTPSGHLIITSTQRHAIFAVDPNQHTASGAVFDLVPIAVSVNRTSYSDGDPLDPPNLNPNPDSAVIAAGRGCGEWPRRYDEKRYTTNRANLGSVYSLVIVDSEQAAYVCGYGVNRILRVPLPMKYFSIP